MDQYDSHHAPGHDRRPEGATPIYDRLLAEWCEASRHEASRREAAPHPQHPVSEGPVRDAGSAFVPAARTADA
ncbi:hypothetical protein OG596_06305 [Streptomyces sp. NBC_01102]|uniref:hypothetical protein n=1 Tax=Streptomyces sp. NBC_01102 TaxID=2903749 RepID=UPI00386A62C0|nr:hypothetical protein OG596_06305 [Streptomyces sp. NBC_01102]